MNNSTERSWNTLLVLALAVAAIMLVPALFMDGMFMDGLLYTCVGKNLATGTGTFWEPQFSATYMQSYHEQPPLMFGMLAVFFRIFGTSLYTERLYCLFMSVMCFFALRMLWNQLFLRHETQRRQLWLPVLLFFISPVTFHAYTNNVEEASMVVFALLSAAFQLKAIRSEGNGYGWFACGGLALIASSMCKGMQGLFPLIIPVTWFMVVRSKELSFRKAFIGNVIVVAVPLLFYLALSLHEPAVHSYERYFHDRLEATFNLASTATTGNRFFLLFELLLNLLLPLAIAVALAVGARRITRTFSREALFLLIVGFSGILPLLVTLEQRGFYLLTGLPFVTSALALLVLDGGIVLQGAVARKRGLRIALNAIAVLFIAGTLVATVVLAGKPKRDADMIHDINLIGAHCGSGALITADYGTWTTWSFQGYLMRYHSISVAKPGEDAPFLVLPKGAAPPEAYVPVQLSTRSYDLYRAQQ
jgi:4-amino-4-deoxy-L-arabinose transferase-like glycosyltransferase